MSDDLKTDHIDITKILDKVPNRFMLSVAVAKRARQLKEGARPLIEVSDDEEPIPVLLALKEIEAGVLDVIIHEEFDEESSMIDKMDRFLEQESKKEEAEEEKVEKKVKESKAKPKAKSLGA